MAIMQLLIGNIGSGKSLIASKLAKMGSVVFNMDAFQEMLSGGLYGAYDFKKRDIYQLAENVTIEESLKRDFSVVIDRTNMDRKRRARFIEIGKRYGARIVAYNFGPGIAEINLRNRAKDCRGVPMQVWTEVFEAMQKSYEPPALDEGIDGIIELPQRYTFHAFDFDGMIVENKFPKIGEIIDGTVAKMNRLYQDLANVIIVWTCRSGEYELAIRKFMNEHHIPYDFINKNPIFDTGSNKVFAHYYYDDRNSK